MKKFSYLVVILILTLAVQSCKKASKRKIRGDWKLVSGTQVLTDNKDSSAFDRYTTAFDGTLATVELYSVTYPAGVLNESTTYTNYSYGMVMSFFKETFKVALN